MLIRKAKSLSQFPINSRKYPILPQTVNKFLTQLQYLSCTASNNNPSLSLMEPTIELSSPTSSSSSLSLIPVTNSSSFPLYPITPSTIQETNELFQTLMKVPLPSQWYLDSHTNTQHTVPNLTWQDIFTYVQSEHWHQTKECTCPHQESLCLHLQYCGQIAYQEAKLLNYTSNQCIKAYFTGLLHDIGKMGTRRIYSNHTAFKGHGIVGGALIDNYYSDELLTIFPLTKHDWADISFCADIHMCSYFPEQTTLLHRYSVNILPESIKLMLRVLRVGDQLAMHPDPSYPKNAQEIYDEVIASEAKYVETLFGSPVPFASLGKTKGILIFLRGGSSAGKSTIAKDLIHYFGSDKVRHINRDFTKVRVVLKMNKQLNHGHYNITYEEMTPELYRICQEKYQQHGKAWSGTINTQMMREIYEGLQQGKICLVDTLAIMHDSISTIIPTIAADAYRIGIWVHRNQIITEQESINRLGMTLEQQYQAHGSTSLYNPFPSNIHWERMISTTETLEDKYLQTHLSFSLGWNKLKQSLYHQILEKINEMYQYNQTLVRTPVLEDTLHMELPELLHRLLISNGVDDFCFTYHYRCMQQIPNAIGIKYIDGINRIWKPRWARQARGRFYYIDHNNQTLVPLKDTLQRGIEVLTKMHVENGITETQDTLHNEYDEFDPIQQSILKRFQTSSTEPFEAYVTGKVDGSLIIVNIYPNECPQYKIIENLVSHHGDSFTKELIQYCIHHQLPLITISTQGTLFIGPDMQDYVITAFQCLLDTSKQIQNINEWPQILPEIVQKIYQYYQLMQLTNKDMVNLCFEAYCKNRLTLQGKLHTELAINYDHHGFNFLGCINQQRYIPHFDLPRKIFKQPIAKKIISIPEIYTLMSQLDQVVLGKLTIKEYLDKYEFTQDEYTSSIIHPEGFVLLTPIPEAPYYDYSKIKTQLYYECHKIRQENISKLLLLPIEVRQYYPIIQRLHDFFHHIDDTIIQLLKDCVNCLRKELHTDSIFYKQQKSKAQQRMLQVIDHYDTATNEEKTVVYRMMINNKSTWNNVQEYWEPIGYKYFQSKNKELILYIKTLCMRLSPWLSDEEWIPMLKELLKNYDDIIAKLYDIVIINEGKHEE